MSDFRIGKMDAYSWDRDILRDILHFVIVYKVKHDGWPSRSTGEALGTNCRGD